MHNQHETANRHHGAVGGAAPERRLMTRFDNQITLADVDPHYQAFVDKFKPKKTTDDCYTPDNIYKVVLDWVVKEYGIDPNNVVRPFWPGGDYMNENYPEGCTVVDNPPFSIISQICKVYNSHGIKYFLFAPYLTNFSTGRTNDHTHIVTDSCITYENGAKVSTSFLTNLDTQYRIRTAPDLNMAIESADYENTHKGKAELPKYKYPDEVITAPMAGYACKYGIDLRIRKTEAFWIGSVQSQKAVGKTIFGGGYLLSKHAAAKKASAEKADAICWELSEAECRIVKSLGKET